MIFDHAFIEKKEIGPEEELRMFVETLHSGDSGYVVPLKKAPGKNMLSFLPSPINDIQDLMQKIDNECNSYITVNDVDGTIAKSDKGWSYGLRKKDNITHLNALFIDVDIKSCHTKNSSMNAEECDRHIQDFEKTLEEKIKNKEFPDNVITIIVHTGRGLQLYLCYDTPVCCAKSLRSDYKTIQKYHEAAGAHLIKQMSSWFDSDVFQFDAVNNVDRVCRLPGTINNSAGRFCHIAYLDSDAKNSQESLFDLIGFEKDAFAEEPVKKEKKKEKKESSSEKSTQKAISVSKKKTKRKKTIIQNNILADDELPRCNAIFRKNASSEIIAIEQIAASRIMTKGSKRNSFCFIYYNLQRIFHNADEALKLTQELNASFEQPLSEEGLLRTINGIDEHIQPLSFSRFSDGIYVFKRETIAKLLDFTEEEIIATNYFANREYEAQRAENKKKKSKRNQTAIALRRQGISIEKIAKEVGCSTKTLQRLFTSEGLGGQIADARGGHFWNNTKEIKKINKEKEKEEKELHDLAHSQEEISSLHESLRSGKNVQLLGGAGTGKTYQIRQFIDYIGIDRVLILAPTSLAASNFDTGKTIHKGLNIQVGPLYPGASIWNVESYVDELYKKDVIVIDEIGAVRFDLFANIVAKLKYYEIKYDKKFQIIVMGDFKQLKPVLKEYERALLKEKWGKEWFGTTGFANETNAWNACNFVEHELTYIYRQEDREFCKAINFARNEQIPECIDYFAKFRNDEEYYNNAGIHLCATNKVKDDINQRIVNDYILKNPKNVRYFKAEYNAEEVNFVNEGFPVEKELIVYPGMYVQTVISTKNYSKDTIGIVKKINKKSVWIQPLNKKKAVKIEYKYIYSEHGKAIKQLPIVPSYAITVHKSQGQSFNGKVYIHVEQFFERYQLYVALSRVTKSENLTIIGKLTKKCFG